MENKTYNFILNEILSKVLELSENPSQFAEYLTHQIRELVGARTIVIAVKEDSGQTKIYSVFPVRRTNWANQSAVLSLAGRSFDFKSVQFLGKHTSDEKIENILQELEIEEAIAIPLIAANRLVGSILLLDIMDSFGIDSVITLLEKLSGVFALVIRNSNLYQNMEDLVAIRTSELQMRNEELKEREKELQNSNEEYEVINEELNQANLEYIAAKDLAVKNEMYTRDILQTAMDGFWIVDQKGQFLDVNEIACKMLGYSRDEMLQMKIANIEVLETAEVIKSRIQKINEKGEDRFESQHRCKDGRIIDVEVSTKLQGSQNLFVCFIHDITQRKKTEREIKETTANLESLLDNRQDSIWSLDRDYNFIIFNKPYAEVFFNEYGVEVKTGMNALEFLPKELHEFWKSKFEPTFHGENVSFEFTHEMNGEVHYFQVFLNPIITNGSITGASALSMDITMRKQAEQLLLATKEKVEESEERFNLAMKASNDGLFDWNLETNEIYYSPGWKKMLGYEDHEIPNDFSVWEKTTAPDDVKKSWELQQKLITKQVDRFVMEFKMKHKDGHWVDILSRAEAVFNEDGKAVRIVGTHTDITDSKRVQNTLKESEARFKALHDASFGGISIHDKGIILECNQGLSEMTGYSVDELIGMNGLLLIAPQHREMVINKIETGYEKSYEANGLRKSGEQFPIRLEARNIPYKGINARTVEFRDISESKKAEYEIKQANEKAEENEKTFRKLFDESSDAILLIDSSGVFVECNQAALDLLNTTRKQFLFNPPTSISPEFQPNGRKSEEAALEMIQLAYEKGLHRFDWTCINSKNEEFIVEVSLMPIIIKGQTMLHTTWRNITQRIKTEVELKEAKDHAEESDRLKSSFLANMSHEIRTPLNSIIGFSDLLDDPDFNEQQKAQFTKAIIENGNNLLVIINDILDLSMLEAKQITIHKEKFSIEKLFSDLSNESQMKAQLKGLDFKQNIPPHNGEVIIESDYFRIKQIFNNLINNAIKFTSNGFIEIGFSQLDQMAEFYVKDTGIGIAPKNHLAIFERFRQIDISKTRKYGGNGLGLAICKNLAEVLGGEIWVNGEEGQGAVFHFTIPYQLPDQTNIESTE